jgi:hypothetical protein
MKARVDIILKWFIVLVFCCVSINNYGQKVPEGWNMATLAFPYCTVEMPVPKDTGFTVSFSEVGGRYERSYTDKRKEISTTLVWGDMSMSKLLKGNGWVTNVLTDNDTIFMQEVTPVYKNDTCFQCYKIWLRIGLGVVVSTPVRNKNLCHQLIDMVRVIPGFNRKHLLVDLLEPETGALECMRREEIDGHKWFVFGTGGSRQDMEEAYRIMTENFGSIVAESLPYVHANAKRYLEGMFQCRSHTVDGNRYMVVALWPTDLYSDTSDLEKELSGRFHSRLSHSRERIFVVTVNLTAGKIEKVEF